MDFFCQFADLTHPESSINRWEDHILTPHNQNIISNAPPKKYNRKNIIANKRKINKPILIQNLDHFLDELPSVKNQEREPSNLNKLKYKIEHIDKDHDRWEEGSMKKIDKIPINLFQRKAKSGFLKAYTEQQHYESKSLEKAKFYSKSIENNHSRRNYPRNRPMSCRTNRSQQPTILSSFQDPKISAIHSKPRIKSHSYSKKSSKENSSSRGFVINQLETGKMKHILKCLSKRQ